MRKKYLSALLFGALLFASAGTFTSCKDYDDDIDNLQSQITDVKNAVTELQKKIADLKYVSSVASEGNGLKITWNDGTSTTINNVINEKMPEIPTPGDVITFDDETGEILINGKGSGYYALVEGEIEEVKVPYVNNDGFLVLIDKDGNELVTNITVAPVSAIKNTDGSYTITILCNGEKQEVVVPSAASVISSITIGAVDHHSAQEWGTSSALTGKVIGIAAQYFEFKKNNSGLSKAADWKGTKTLPADKDVVFSSPTTIDIRINPVSVDATDVKFYFTNTKNNDLNPMVFKAVAEDGDTPLTNTNGRAANTGNGLWTLKMDNVVVKKADYDPTGNSGISKALNDAVTGGWVYAINAEHSCRSEYILTAKNAKVPVLSTINLKQGATTEATGINVTTTTATTGKSYKVGTPVKVVAEQESALYDMYLSADDSDIRVYGLTFDQENHTFTIGKNPDVSSIPAEFDLLVWTAANDGNIRKQTITVKISTEMQAEAEYSLITHNVNVSDAKYNYFGIDLATMKTALGGQLDAWMQNVDLTDIRYTWDDKKDGTFTNRLPSGISANLVSELKEIGNEAFTTNRNKANFLQVNVVNSSVSGLNLDKTYYIKASFVTSSDEALNEIIVPVTFKAPKLADLFAVKSGYVVDNVINAYFYRVTKNADGTIANNYENVELTKYFDKYVDDATVNFTDTKVEGTDKAGSDLYKLLVSRGGSGVDANFNKVYVELNGGKDTNGKPQGGYAKAVELRAKKDNFENWKYTTDGDDTYKLKIRLMSPIEQGTIAPVGGSSIVINGNDLVAGAKITDQQIVGKDYNGNTYSVVSDRVGGSGTTPTANWYLNPQIKSVTAAADASNYIQSITYKQAENATAPATGVVTGWFTVKGNAISNTVDVKMPVTVEDSWGYKKTVEVPVTIKKN